MTNPEAGRGWALRLGWALLMCQLAASKGARDIHGYTRACLGFEAAALVGLSVGYPPLSAGAPAGLAHAGAQRCSAAQVIHIQAHARSPTPWPAGVKREA